MFTWSWNSHVLSGDLPLLNQSLMPSRTIYIRTQFVKFHMISRFRLQYIVETHETTNMRSIVKWSLSESDVRSQQLKGNIKSIRGRKFYEKNCFMGFKSTLITANLYKTWFNFCADRARKSYANSQIESLYKLSLVLSYFLTSQCIGTQANWRLSSGPTLAITFNSLT